MISRWEPFRESLRATLLRSGIIAMVAGAALAGWRRDFSRWPLAALLVFWLSFGGHWVELFFLNWLRLRLPAARGVQITARLAVWFLGGIALATGMYLTAMALADFPPARWPAWWLGGPAFIGIELVVHLALQLRGLPSFFNGRG